MFGFNQASEPLALRHSRPQRAFLRHLLSQKANLVAKLPPQRGLAALVNEAGVFDLCDLVLL
jgi:hypothetical protein